MIFALRHPSVLLGLLLGFVVGIALRGLAQRAVGRGLAGSGRLRPVGGRAPLSAGGWAAYFDPFGAVAALLSGVGWGSRVDPGFRRRNADLAMLAVALLVHAALAAVGFAAVVAAGFPRALLDLPVSSVVHGSLALPTAGQSVAMGFAMVNLACGLLCLVPIPPLELGVVLWRRLPRSAGARRLAYHLLEEQWGVAVVLVLLLLPLAGQQPALLALIDTVGDAILGLV